jgi:hypothetical protein
MQLKLIGTTIASDCVRMRYADDPDPAKATNWLDFSVSVSDLLAPQSMSPLGPILDRHLVVIQQAALRAARRAIDAETAVLDSQKDRTV